MDALDLIEFGGLDVAAAVERVVVDPTKPLVHEAVARWIGHAVSAYVGAKFLDGSAVEDAGLQPLRAMWVVQVFIAGGQGQQVYEICAWGRRYETEDGRLRELRLPTMSGRPRDRDRGEVAVAAYVVAYGNQVADLWRQTPYPVGAASSARRARVVEVRCADAPARTLFDGSADQAAELYASAAREPLRRAVDGGAYTPGTHCADCKMINVCPALPRLPQLLPIPTTARGPRTRRRWSATTGRDYRVCPAREYLRRIRLPRDAAVEYGPAAIRGQAVHAWLNQAHERIPLGGCGPDDVPDNPGSWTAGRWVVTGEEAQVGRDALTWHAGICALATLPAGAVVRVEPRITVHDTASDTLVLATPDLLYRDGDGWVWREVKTTRRGRFRDGLDLLRMFPQLAIAVGLLWQGALPGDRHESRIEVEQLSPTQGVVDVLVPADLAVRQVAREVVAELVSNWHGDSAAQPRPGENCHTCEVSLWCPSAALGEPVTSVGFIDFPSEETAC